MKKNYHYSERFYNYLNIKEFISIKTLSKHATYSIIRSSKLTALFFVLLISNFVMGASSINLTSVSPSQGCFGTATPITIVFTKSGAFSGNVFTAQLSNSSGSFASPINIGSVTSNTAVPINAVIPSGTAAGNGYRIRVVASSPVITSNNTIGFTVNPTSIGGSVSSSTSACSGDNGGTLSLSGHTGTILEWQFSTDGGSNWTVISNTTASQTYNNLTTSTLYRARIQSGSCPSAISSVATITISPCTKVRNADCGATLSTLNQIIYCDPVAGAVNYDWEFVNSASGFNSSRMTNNSGLGMTPSFFTGIEYNKTYDVRVRAKVGTQWGPFSTICQITTPATMPGTSVRALDCGITLSALNQSIYCNPVAGAVNYEWEFVNTASGYSNTRMRNNSGLGMDPSLFAGIEYNTTYDVRVRAKVGTLWGAFSSVCQISTPALIPATKIRYTDCGITLSAMNQLIFCDYVAGAVNYEWEFVNTTTGYSCIKTRNNNGLAWDPAWAGSLVSNQTYNVRVRAKVGLQWGSYGAVCQITTFGYREMAQINEMQNDEAETAEKKSNPEKPNVRTFSSYPNPSTGLLTIDIPATGQLEIYNQNGQNVFTKSVNDNNITTILNLSHLNDGIYTLKIQDSKNVHISRILIQK